MGLSVPITVATLAGSQLVVGGGGRIVFTSVVENTGAANAGFTLFDGNPASLQGLMDFNVNASGSVRDAWPEHGVPFEGDLWIGNISGNATVRIHVVPEDLWDRWRREYWRELANLITSGEGA